MSAEVVSGSDVPSSALPFSPGLRVGDFVFVSGQASVDATGAIVSDSFEGELRRSFENLQRVLAGAGLGFEHVVQVRSYIEDPADLVDYNRLYRDYLSEPLPARTTLCRCLGGKLKFEVDAVAYGGGARQLTAPNRHPR